MNHPTMPQNDSDCPSRIFRVHFFGEEIAN